MKSPEIRKELSELTLHKRGIRLNLQLPTIESEDEIQIRGADEVLQRLQALATVCTYPQHATDSSSAALSKQEQALLDGNLDDASALQLQQSSRHALCFLMWAAGLENKPGMPDQHSGQPDLQKITTVDDARTLHLRSKTELLDWAELLYRFHWAVRHAHLQNRPVPGRLDAIAVEAWHRAANWMICYEDEADWDLVSTETAG